MTKKIFFVLLAVFLLSIPALVLADHSWNNYHWARSSNPLVLGLGDNVDSQWDSYLATSSVDWSKSSVLDTPVVAGQASGNCRAATGRAEVCNDAYGNNGWLGIAQITVSGGHITSGVAKMNDTYFNTPTYNTPAWRNLVMCQEIGHIFGLGHNDEDFNTTNGTCMDYSNNPEPNQHPDQHDYQQLEAIYAHLDGGGSGGGGGGEEPCRGGPKKCPNGVGLGVAGEFDHPSEWGQLLRQEGRHAIYERNFGNNKIITFVTWAH